MLQKYLDNSLKLSAIATLPGQKEGIMNSLAVLEKDRFYGPILVAIYEANGQIEKALEELKRSEKLNTLGKKSLASTILSKIGGLVWRNKKTMTKVGVTTGVLTFALPSLVSLLENLDKELADIDGGEQFLQFLDSLN